VALAHVRYSIEHDNVNESEQSLLATTMTARTVERAMRRAAQPSPQCRSLDVEQASQHYSELQHKTTHDRQHILMVRITLTNVLHGGGGCAAGAVCTKQQQQKARCQQTEENIIRLIRFTADGGGGYQQYHQYVNIGVYKIERDKSVAICFYIISKLISM
jgi:hypothetical protein